MWLCCWQFGCKEMTSPSDKCGNHPGSEASLSIGANSSWNNSTGLPPLVPTRDKPTYKNHCSQWSPQLWSLHQVIIVHLQFLLVYMSFSKIIFTIAVLPSNIVDNVRFPGNRHRKLTKDQVLVQKGNRFCYYFAHRHRLYSFLFRLLQPPSTQSISFQ